MIPFHIHEKGGILRLVIILAIVLILLAYFGLNLRSIVGSPTFQDNWNFLTNLVVNVWNNYLKVPVLFLWNTIVVPLIWNPAVNHLKDIQTSSSTVTATVPH